MRTLIWPKCRKKLLCCRCGVSSCLTALLFRCIFFWKCPSLMLFTFWRRNWADLTFFLETELARFNAGLCGGCGHPDKRLTEIPQMLDLAVANLYAVLRLLLAMKSNINHFPGLLLPQHPEWCRYTQILLCLIMDAIILYIAINHGIYLSAR